MPTFTESNPHCAFLLTQPFTPTALSDRIDEILFMDLGFQSVSKRLIQCMSAHNYLKTTKDTTSCCLVVDSGFSLTHIVPTLDTKAVENAIRRINIGGKLITNLYKEAISYRQWNMMDELFIMNEVKEKTSFVSNDFQHDLGHHARKKRPGYRWYDREFVLPDFVNTFSGNVRLPPPLRKQQMIKDKERLQKLEESLKEKMDEQDSSMGKKEKEETGKDMKEEKNIDDDDENGEDSDNESDEQQKEQLRLLKLQEQRRRELEQQEQQVLSLSVERFTIPEVLFHPSDIGLDQVGIVAGIVQAISACDPTLHAAMYQNIILTGGSVKLSGFRERLEKELRAATPDQYDVNITLPEDPIGYPWEGASDFAQTNGFLEKSCLDKYSWEESRTARKGKDDFFLWTKVHEGKEIEKDNYIVV